MLTYLDRAKDDYAANRQLRDAMRLKRKASKALELSNTGIVNRLYSNLTCRINGEQNFWDLEDFCLICFFAEIMSRSCLQGSNVRLLPENKEDIRTAALLR